MKEKSINSIARVTTELFLLIIGCIAIMLLVFVFFYDFSTGIFYFEHAKIKWDSVISFNASVYVYVLLILAIILPIRFILYVRKVMKQNREDE